MKLIPLEIQCSEPMSEATTFITDAIVNYSYDGEYLILPGKGANVGETLYFSGKFGRG